MQYIPLQAIVLCRLTGRWNKNGICVLWTQGIPQYVYPCLPMPSLRKSAECSDPSCDQVTLHVPGLCDCNLWCFTHHSLFPEALTFNPWSWIALSSDQHKKLFVQKHCHSHFHLGASSSLWRAGICWWLWQWSPAGICKASIPQGMECLVSDLSALKLFKLCK